MRVSIEDNSIPNSAILDYGNVSNVSSSGGSGSDSSIITLVANETINTNDIVCTDGGVGAGKADWSQYNSRQAIGFALNSANNGENVNVKISGILNIENTQTELELYLNQNATFQPFVYQQNYYLQKVADKINDNQIFINIEKSVLML